MSLTGQRRRIRSDRFFVGHPSIDLVVVNGGESLRWTADGVVERMVEWAECMLRMDKAAACQCFDEPELTAADDRLIMLRTA